MTDFITSTLQFSQRVVLIGKKNQQHLYFWAGVVFMVSVRFFFRYFHLSHRSVIMMLFMNVGIQSSMSKETSEKRYIPNISLWLRTSPFLSLFSCFVSVEEIEGCPDRGKGPTIYRLSLKTLYHLKDWVFNATERNCKPCRILVQKQNVR